jgi:hypothetical protein
MFNHNYLENLYRKMEERDHLAYILAQKEIESGPTPKIEATEKKSMSPSPIPQKDSQKSASPRKDLLKQSPRKLN